LLQHGVILPSPIRVELLEFPSKMIYVLERRRLILFKASRIPRMVASLFQKTGD
jgi:hypothetical protein